MNQEVKERPYIGRVRRKGRWIVEVLSVGDFFEQEIAIEESNIPRGIFFGAKVCFGIAIGPGDRPFAVNVEWYNGSQGR